MRQGTKPIAVEELVDLENIRQLFPQCSPGVNRQDADLVTASCWGRRPGRLWHLQGLHRQVHGQLQVNEADTLHVAYPLGLIASPKFLHRSSATWRKGSYGKPL